MSTERDPPDTVNHSPGATWTQDDLGDDLAVGPLSVIGELDPTGAQGTLKEVLAMFMESLDPMLTDVEHHRAHGYATGIRFQAHKLQSASAQIGATRLAASTRAITAYFASGGSLATGPLDPALSALVDSLVAETIRLQRRLHHLLA